MGDQNGSQDRLSDLYRELAEKSIDTIFLFLLDGRIVHANPAALSAYGYTLDEIKTKTIRDLRAPETHAALEGQLERVRAGSFRFESTHRRRDGSEFPVESTWTLAKLDGKEVVLSVVRDISDRKDRQREHEVAIENLRESEERYERLVEQSIDCIFLASTDGKYTDVNAAGAEMFRMTRDELLAVSIPDILHPDEHHRILPTIEKLASGDVINCGEWRYVRKDGSEFVGELLGKQMPDGTLQGILRDVTDRKAAEAALRESEMRWKTVTETLPNLVWTDLPDGQCDWLSSQWEDYTGIPVQEMLGLNWVDMVIHPDDRERTIKCWNDACAGLCDYDLEYRIRRHDGEYHWFKTRGVPIRDDSGKIVYWFGTCTDIEDIKRAEAARRESEATLRAFYDNSPVFMGITELVGDDIFHVYDNPATCGFFGVEPNATAHKFAKKDLGADPDVVELWTRSYREAEETGSPVKFEHLHPSGEGPRWLSVTVSMLGRSDSGRTRFCYVAEDVTERKQAEQELRAARDVLEDTVAARTAELRKLALDLQAEVEVRKGAEARLRQLMTRLVNIQEEERRRIGRNIHDHLGQQLTGLRINLASLESQTANMNGIADLARKIQGLAEELDSSIDFVTWELIPGEIASIGLPAALRELVSAWSRRFDIPAEFNARGPIAVELPDNVSSNLYRIAQEALHNVVKHAVASHADVLFEIDDSGIKLIVEDDGQGFTPESNGHNGHSLGLISMRERASALDGTFELESSAGNGTTIFVRVPLEVPAAPRS